MICPLLRWLRVSHPFVLSHRVQITSRRTQENAKKARRVWEKDWGYAAGNPKSSPTYTICTTFPKIYIMLCPFVFMALYLFENIVVSFWCYIYPTMYFLPCVFVIQFGNVRLLFSCCVIYLLFILYYFSLVFSFVFQDEYSYAQDEVFLYPWFHASILYTHWGQCVI